MGDTDVYTVHHMVWVGVVLIADIPDCDKSVEVI